jgi:predicted secreted Zn-dependent protease
MSDLNLLALAREMRGRAEETRAEAETSNDPECKRLLRRIAQRFEEVAQRLEREAGAADKA